MHEQITRGDILSSRLANDGARLLQLVPPQNQSLPGCWVFPLRTTRWVRRWGGHSFDAKRSSVTGSALFINIGPYNLGVLLFWRAGQFGWLEAVTRFSGDVMSTKENVKNQRQFLNNVAPTRRTRRRRVIGPINGSPLYIRTFNRCYLYDEWMAGNSPITTQTIL